MTTKEIKPLTPKERQALLDLIELPAMEIAAKMQRTRGHINAQITGARCNPRTQENICDLVCQQIRERMFGPATASVALGD